MPTKRIFANLLSTRLSDQHENITSESFAYILNQSTAAKKAFLQFINQRIMKLPEDLIFTTQVHNANKAVPDVSGFDSHNRLRVIIEAKFWASLTDHQPVDYIPLLNKEDNSVLIFVVPEKRQEIIKEELIWRCSKAGISLSERNNHTKGVWVAQFGDCQYLSVTSWGSVLEYISEELRVQGDIDFLADLIQIKNFCEYVDSTAFLPLLPSELDSNHGLRLSQFISMVDKLVKTLKKTGVIDTWSGDTKRTLESYGKYASIAATEKSSYRCLIEFNAENWGKYANTPLWIKIKSGDWKYPLNAKERIMNFCLSHNISSIDLSDGILLPLYLKTGAEEDEVIKDLAETITSIRDVLIS